jgi:hypothetical protein
LQAEPSTIRTIGELSSSLREPFLFVVVGEVKAGKSSLHIPATEARPENAVPLLRRGSAISWWP